MSIKNELWRGNMNYIHTYIQRVPKECIQILRDVIYVQYYFSKLNWITVAMCSRTFAQNMALIKWMRHHGTSRTVRENGGSTAVVRGVEYYNFNTQLLERQPCFHHFLWLSCLSHGDASIHLINAIFWANVLLHIATIIQFNFEK
jgi:hypothetical protein